MPRFLGPIRIQGIREWKSRRMAVVGRGTPTSKRTGWTNMAAGTHVGGLVYGKSISLRAEWLQYWYPRLKFLLTFGPAQP